MRNIITLVWILTPLSNALLCLLLVWRGWSARLQWLTLWCGAAVAADAVFWILHATNHAMYGPLRVFTVYWFFNILMALVVFEAWRVGVGWLEGLVSVQLFITLAALFAHKHGDVWTVYWIEIFNILFNFLSIWYCILRFRGEARYRTIE